MIVRTKYISLNLPDAEPIEIFVNTDQIVCFELSPYFMNSSSPVTAVRFVTGDLYNLLIDPEDLQRDCYFA